MSRPLRLALAWGSNAAALWLASDLLGGVRIHGAAAYLLGAAVLGLANTILKPLVTLVTLPLVLLTLGLFLLLINVAMVALAAWATPHFTIHGARAYLGTVVIVWLVNWARNLLIERPAKRRRR